MLSQTVIKSKLNRRGFFGAVGGAVVGAMLAAGVRRVAPLVAAPEEVATVVTTIVNPEYLAAPYEIAFLVSDTNWARPVVWDRKIVPPPEMRQYTFPPRLTADGKFVPPTIEIQHPVT